MGALMRSIDWRKTPLGAVASWPPVLQSSVSLMLNSLFPTAILWGPDLYILYNDAYRPVLGSKHPQSLGRPCRECWSEIWDVVGPLLRQPLQGGAAVWLDSFLLEMNRHGYLEETYFVASYSPIRDGAQVGGVLATCYEVTDQVTSERRLRTLTELAVQLNRENDADEVCRVTSRILYSNPLDVPFAMLYLLEEDGKSVRLGAAAGMDEYVGPANPRTVSLAPESAHGWPLAEAIRTGQSLVVDDLNRRFGPMPGGKWQVPAQSAFLIPIGLPRSADHLGFLITGVSPRRTLDNHYCGFFELAADHIAAALRKARAYDVERRRAEALARADRAKDEFLAMLGHELRNPLSPIVTALQLMKLRGETALAREREVIEKHVQYVARLVNDLLDVSKLTRGRITLERAVIDLADVIASAIEMSSPLIEERFHELIVSAPREELFVEGDALRLAQVIANLLTNAAKYTPPHGKIRVRCERENAEAVISVEDNGQGIEPELADRVFELFAEGQTESGTKRTGLGLGLAIVKSLVSMHGGSITVESAGASQGSEFTVRLPVLDVKQRPAKAQVESPRLTAQQAVMRRIMIVDDNEDSAQVLAEVLELIGHDTHIAHDAPSALQTVSGFAPDVILMDIGLPVMDGYELARAIRAMTDLRSPRLIALTGYGQESDRQRAFEAGFDEHLVKPIRIERLLFVLQGLER